MKKPAKKLSSPGNVTKLNDFVRGFVSAGLAIGQRSRPMLAGHVLHHALQGGIAMTAATAAAHATQQRNYANAVIAVVVGAAGIYALDCLLRGKTRIPGEEHGKQTQETQGSHDSQRHRR